MSRVSFPILQVFRGFVVVARSGHLHLTCLDLGEFQRIEPLAHLPRYDGSAHPAAAGGCSIPLQFRGPEFRGHRVITTRFSNRVGCLAFLAIVP